MGRLHSVASARVSADHRLGQMRRFHYFEPRSFEEAGSLLRDYQGSASILAGGTDLLVEMRERLRRCEHVIDIKKIPEAELPEEVRKLDAPKRMEYVQAKAKERADVQAQIKDLSARREKVVQEEIQKQGLSKDKALDEAVKQSITQQAKQKGFEFEEQK